MAGVGLTVNQVDPDFWRGKRVFVTGHTGFKGAWLTFWLSEMGAKVRGYALAPEAPDCTFHALGIENRCDSVIADIRARDMLGASIAQFQPDIVIHMAAQPLVRYSYEAPLDTFDANVMGTANLLDACRNAPHIRAIVSVTSDKCYDNREWLHSYRENDAMGGYDPYSASKGCAELVTSAFRRSYFEDSPTRVVSVRSGNVIGGGDRALDRLVPDAMRAFAAGNPLIIRAPDAIRPWQHVVDPLRGYLLYAERAAQGGKLPPSLNFGPSENDTRSVREVVEALAGSWGEGAVWRIEAPAHALHEATLLRLDSGLARATLKWKPRFVFEGSIANSVAWYRLYDEKGPSEALLQLTRSQIGLG